MKRTFTADVHLAAMEAIWESHYRNLNGFDVKMRREFFMSDSK